MSDGQSPLPDEDAHHSKDPVEVNLTLAAFSADGYGLVLARTNIRPSCFAIILSTSLFGGKSGKDQFFSLCGMAV